MKREFNNAKWTLAAVGYQCAFAYTIALIVYQLGLLFSGAGFTVATAIAILLLAGLVYLVVRKNPYNDNHLTTKLRSRRIYLLRSVTVTETERRRRDSVGRSSYVPYRRTYGTGTGRVRVGRVGRLRRTTTSSVPFPFPLPRYVRYLTFRYRTYRTVTR